MTNTGEVEKAQEDDSVATVIVGVDGVVKWSSTAANTLLGHAELVGTRLEALCPKSRRGDLRNVYDVLAGKTSRRIRSYVQCADGTPLAVAVQIDPCTSAEGEVVGAAVRYDLLLRPGAVCSSFPPSWPASGVHPPVEVRPGPPQGPGALARLSVPPSNTRTASELVARSSDRPTRGSPSLPAPRVTEVPVRPSQTDLRAVRDDGSFSNAGEASAPAPASTRPCMPPVRGSSPPDSLSGDMSRFASVPPPNAEPRTPAGSRTRDPLFPSGNVTEHVEVALQLLEWLGRRVAAPISRGSLDDPRERSQLLSTISEVRASLSAHGNRTPR